MSRHLEDRLRSLECMTVPAPHAVGCPACENWHVEYREGDEPDPPRQCNHQCGRLRPTASVWLIRVVPTITSATEART